MAQVPVLPALAAALLSACAGGCGEQAGFPDGTDADTRPPSPCPYPEDVADPMAEGSALPRYYWATAKASGASDQSLEMGEAYCDEDADIDWSPFDVLLFVSIPAW